MKKISIIGNGGSGKSTLSNKLSEKLNIPVYHLDQIFWKSGCQKINTAEWLKTNEELTAKDNWIIDGNYRNCMNTRLKASDTIIFMDFSRYKCYLNSFNRYFKYRGKSRPDVTDGCNERITWEYLYWLWRYKKEFRPSVIEKLNKLSDKKIIILRNKKEVKKFVEELNS